MYKLHDNGALFFNNKINQQFPSNNQINSINLRTNLYHQNNHLMSSLNSPNFPQNQFSYTNNSQIISNVFYIFYLYRIIKNNARI